VIPNGQPKEHGIAVGEEVASMLLAARANDGSAAIPAVFVAGNQPGDYRSTPPISPRRFLVTGER